MAPDAALAPTEVAEGPVVRGELTNWEAREAMGASDVVKHLLAWVFGTPGMDLKALTAGVLLVIYRAEHNEHLIDEV